ncbi:hypothetical protein D357_00181 [Enterococcus faecium SD3B-2]|nr:hypothetical protein D357_00181 [Enterococcus faecium SD3B-2]
MNFTKIDYSFVFAPQLGQVTVLATPLGNFLPQLKQRRFFRTALVNSRLILVLLGVLTLILTFFKWFTTF